MSTAVSQDVAVVDVLTAARRTTGMQVAFLAEFDGPEKVLRCLDGDAEALGLHVGQRTRREETYCQRMIDGRLDRVVPDTAADPETADLAITTEAGIRGYVGVPVRLPDGQLYGSLCCVDAEPQPDLDERDADVLQSLAGLLGHHLQAGRDAERVVRERDELLASVSHDLRTPLMALRFLGEDLEQQAADPVVAGGHIRREADRVLSMVEDLMMVTRHRAGTAVLQPGPADLVALVEEAGRDLAVGEHREHASRLAVHVPDAGLVASVDANRVLRALRNMLDNAFRYAPDGPVTLELRRDGTTAVVSVADRGPGIPAEDLPHVHERFFRSEEAVRAGVVGTGLGLALAQAVADLHEGTLELRSELGEGTWAALRLPLERAAAG